MQCRSANNFKGIDISNWQKGINLQDLKNKGYEVCYIKITEGSTYQDPSFEENYQKAKDSNMKIGIYHFWRGTSSPETQVDNIIKTLGDKKIDCKIAIDVEAIDGLENKEITDSVLKIAKLLEEKTKNKPCIYCNSNFARNILDNRLKGYPVWIAHYGVEKPADNPIWDKWAGFQYTDKGISNLGSSLDLDEFTYEILLDKTDIPSKMEMELLDKNKNKVASLKEFKNREIKHFYDTGKEYLTFEYDTKGEDVFNNIKEDYVKSDKQIYKVILVKDKENDYKKIVCTLDLDTLENKYFKEFNNQYNTIDVTFDSLLKDTGWSFEKVNINKKRLILKYDSNILKIIDRINEIFNIRVSFDTINKKISIIPLENKGDYDKDKLNIIDDDDLEFDNDYATRLIPIGKDGLTIEKINNGKDSIENHSYTNSIKEIVWRDNSYLYAEDLKEDAIFKLKERCKPYQKYEISISDLIKQSKLHYDDYRIGCQINVNKIGILTTIQLKEYPENPEKNIGIFANSTLKKINPTNKLKEISDIINAITIGDGIIDLKQLQGFKDSVLDVADIQKILDGMKRLNLDKANISDLNTINANIKNLEVENANIKNASIENLKVINANIKNLESENANIKNATIENLKTINGNIKNLESENANIHNLISDKANITDLQAQSAKIKVLESDTANINTALISKATIEELNAFKINTKELISIKADIKDLNVVKANIQELNSSKANITDLTVANGKINNLESNTADIKTLLNGNLSSENIQSGGITSDRLTIANGFIKDAMIENLSIDKILADYINTNKLKLKSEDGSMELIGSTQQFKDEKGNVRIQMGKDTQGNFNFIIRDKDGKSVLIDENGIRENAVPDGLIQNNMIANQGIEGSKININSMINELNKDENTSLIKSNKILLDEDGQSLEIAFNSMKTTVENVEKNTTYDVDIVSTNGSIFKNGKISTTLIAIVYHGAEDITDKIDESKFIWTRISNDKDGDIIWNQRFAGGRKKINVTKDDVNNKATFNCSIIK